MQSSIWSRIRSRQRPARGRRARPLYCLGFGLALLAAAGLAGAQTLPGGGTKREHWIAADEVLWDYAPSFPIDPMTGEEFTPEQRVFVEDGIGRLYVKSIFREYTAGFAQLIERNEEEMMSLGLLGPIMHAEVGDTLVVHFLNNTQFPASVHPHGVFYNKDSEGTLYEDGTTGADKLDDDVPPGGTHDYVWSVPKRAGPGPNDPTSIVWLYHGHRPEVGSTNAGLIGAFVVTAKGKAKADGSPKGVDRELFTLFNIFDENASSYLDINLSRCASGSCDPEDEEFQESNLMHSMNGLVYGNNMYMMRVGEKVRWYLMAMGTEVDLHSPHWHGTTVLYNGNRLDVTELLPASTKTVDLVPDNVGQWMYHCHVNDHITAGMMGMYMVMP